MKHPTGQSKRGAGAALAVVVGALVATGLPASAGGSLYSVSGAGASAPGTPSVAAPAPGKWVPIGPSEILGPKVDAGQYHATGRLTTMAVDPRNPDVIYVGSPGQGGDEGSGVWKTTDGGTSWTPIADDLPSLAVAAIALDPTNPDRVYVVLYHYGLYRSDDAGSTWTQVYDKDLHVRTNIGPDADRTVLLINPLHPRVLFLTSDLGVLRSEDGGENWPVSLGENGATQAEGGATSLVMDPQDPDVLYAAMSSPAWDPNSPPAVYRTGTVYKTDNGGERWVPQDQQDELPSGTIPWRNILLAISHPPSDANETVYALFPRGPIIDNGGGLFGGIGYDLFRTTDGENWSPQFSCLPDRDDYRVSYVTCNFAVMSANPVDPNIVYLGGVALWVSFYGGATPERVPSADNHFDSQPYAPHGDYWELVTDPLNPAILYATSDGGIYKSSDSPYYGMDGTWKFIGEGITNTEMHDLALARMVNGVTRATAGTVDNGTILSDQTLDWHRFAGGDGDVVAIDPVDPNRLYLSYGDGGLYQYSYPSEEEPQPFYSGIPKQVWQNCHAYDQTLQLLIYPSPEPVSEPMLDACGSLWRRTDLSSTGKWNAIFTPTSDSVVRVAIDPSTDVYYAGTFAGRVYAGLHGENWGKPVFEHPDSLKLSDLEVDRAHPDTLYASFAPWTRLDRNCSVNAGGSRIYRLRRSSPVPSTLEFTATDMTGNFPTGPGGEKRCVNALAIDPHIPRTVYAATDKGIYRGRSNATGGPWVWEPYNNGMPPADVRDLELDRDAGQLYAATIGRGAFKVTLETTLPVSIDIKPDTSENTINIKSGGKIPVAILSSVDFDAPNEVDRNSLRFGRTGAEPSLASCSAGGQDVNGDGLLDLVCHFYTPLTGFQVGDTLGRLKGSTVEGVPIEGSDAVKILNQ